MANKNIVEVLVQPQVPKVLDNQNIFVYMPLATNNSSGLVKPDVKDFIIGENGTLQFNWEGSGYSNWSGVFKAIDKFGKSLDQIELNRQQLFDDVDKAEGKDTIKKKVEKNIENITDINNYIGNRESLDDETLISAILKNSANITANTSTIKSHTTSIEDLEKKIKAGVLKIVKVNSFNDLPTKDISTTSIYLVPITDNGNNAFEEYIYVDNTWELIGTTRVDLSGYLTEEAADGKYIQSSITSGEGAAQTSILYVPTDTTARSAVGGIEIGTDLTTLYKDNQTGIQLKTLLDSILGVSKFGLRLDDCYFTSSNGVTLFKWTDDEEIDNAYLVNNVVGDSDTLKTVTCSYERYNDTDYYKPVTKYVICIINGRQYFYTPLAKSTASDFALSKRGYTTAVNTISSDGINLVEEQKITIMIREHYSNIASDFQNIYTKTFHWSKLYHINVKSTLSTGSTSTNWNYYSAVGKTTSFIVDTLDNSGALTLTINSADVLFEEIKDDNGLNYIDCFDVQENDGITTYTLKTPVTMDNVTLYVKLKKRT